MIPYGCQDITQEDIDVVTNVLASDFLTQGPQVPLFEKTVANHVGVKHAVAVNSATSALHIACLALGVGHGDWLWTSPITFVASANCGLYCGAKVDFVDIDPLTCNISPVALEAKLIEAEKVGRLPKVVVAVHLRGQSCDMVSIYALGRKYGFRIIEDASHAIGGRYREDFIGKCRYSDITIFSFHPVKIITTAEGGMAVTNCDELAQKLALLRSHGITRDVELMMRNPDGPWYYEQIELGFNYRMTELQAALGVSQMQRLDRYVERRHEVAQRYNSYLKDLPVSVLSNEADCYSSFHLYVIRLQLNLIKKSHRQVFEYMRSEGVGVNVHYIPIHLQPYYQRMGFKLGDFIEAEKYYREAISLPIFPNITNEQLENVIRALKRALTQ